MAYIGANNKYDQSAGHSLNMAIRDLDDRREKQRSQMKMMAEAIAQKRKDGDTRQFNFEVDEYGGVNTNQNDKSHSYLDFFKNKDYKLFKEKGENSVTYEKMQDTQEGQSNNPKSDGNISTNNNDNISSSGTSNDSSTNIVTNEEIKEYNPPSDEYIDKFYQAHVQISNQNGTKPQTKEEFTKVLKSKPKDIPINPKGEDLNKKMEAIPNSNGKTPSATPLSEPSENSADVLAATAINQNKKDFNNLLQMGERDKVANYSARVNDPTFEDSSKEQQIYKKITTSNPGFEGQVGSSYNDLMSNSMMSNANNAYGHGSNAGMWSGMAEKAYQEKKAYEATMNATGRTEELIKMGENTYTTKAGGGGRSYSQDLKESHGGKGSGANKPSVINLKSSTGKSFTAAAEYKKVKVNNVDMEIQVVNLIGGDDRVDIPASSIYSQQEAIKKAGFIALPQGDKTIYQNGDVKFSISKDGQIMGQIPSNILSGFGVNSERGR